MSRLRQPVGRKGSLKWIQRAIAFRPDLIQPEVLPEITWVSPLVDDEFAEYRDGDFVRKLGLPELAPNLQEFWPRGGPQWDALGVFPGAVVLAEAKAHLAEFASPRSQASEASRIRIEAAFLRVKSDLGVSSEIAWTEHYYQFANRIAHLWFLRNLDVDAHLVLIGFVGDDEMGGPREASAWSESCLAAEAVLGLPVRHGLSQYIHHVHPPVYLLGQSF